MLKLEEWIDIRSLHKDNIGQLAATTTSYTYDKASNRMGFTDTENGSTTYAYDTLNRLQTLTPPAAFTFTGNFGFTYDALSRRTQMTRPSTAAKAALSLSVSRINK